MKVLSNKKGEAEVVRPTYIREQPFSDAGVVKDGELKVGEHFHYVSTVEGETVEVNEYPSKEWYKLEDGKFVAKLDCEKYSLAHTH